jgi:hypothetical protein
MQLTFLMVAGITLAAVAGFLFYKKEKCVKKPTDKVQKAMVRIVVDNKTTEGRGFIWHQKNKEVFIVTSAQFIKEASNIVVLFPDHSVAICVVRGDVDNILDLALLSTTSEGNFDSLDWACDLQIGEDVFLGEHSGTISKLGLAGSVPFLTTDIIAPKEPAPIVNSKGEVCALYNGAVVAGGVHSLITKRSINRMFMNKLTSRGYIGIKRFSIVNADILSDLCFHYPSFSQWLPTSSPDLWHGRLLIEEYDQEKLPIEWGDILIELQGVNIGENLQINQYSPLVVTSYMLPGEKLVARFFRPSDCKYFNLDIQLEEFPHEYDIPFSRAF